MAQGTSRQSNLIVRRLWHFVLVAAEEDLAANKEDLQLSHFKLRRKQYPICLAFAKKEQVWTLFAACTRICDFVSG